VTDDSPQLLATLEVGFQPYAAHLVMAARQAGVPLVIISGRRRAALNAEVGGATHSLHLYGYAFDVQVLGYTRDQVPLWWWEALGRYWEAMGGRWGGRFSTPDVNHFDSGGVPV